MSLLTDLAEDLLRKQAIKLAKKEARKAYAVKAADDLGLAQRDVEAVLDWLVEKVL